jgi:streptogramin lyase
VLLAVGALTGCGAERVAERAAETTGPPDVRPRVTAKVVIDLGDFSVEGIAAGEGAVWVAGGQSVSRIDPARNEVTHRLSMDGWAADVATGEGSAWVAREGDVLRLDPATAEIEARIDLPRAGLPYGIATGFGAVWVSVSHAPSSGEVIRIDPVANEVAARISTRGYAGELEAGAGAVWVMSHPEYTDETRIRETSMQRIDPVTNQLETVFREPGVELGAALFAKVLAAGEDAVWVQAWNPEFPYGAEALRVGAESGEVTRRPLGIKRFFPFAVAEGGVWFAGPEAGIARLDPETLKVDAELDLDAHIVDADYDAEERAFWIADPLIRRGQQNHAIRVDVD